MESTRGQSISVDKPKGRIQMFLIWLDRYLIKVLFYLSEHVLHCPTQTYFSSHIWSVCIWSPSAYSMSSCLWIPKLNSDSGKHSWCIILCPLKQSQKHTKTGGIFYVDYFLKPDIHKITSEKWISRNHPGRETQQFYSSVQVVRNWCWLSLRHIKYSDIMWLGAMFQRCWYR